MPIIYILLIISISYKGTAQITLIPDANFEMFLIEENIDTDGIVNGQILTQDVLTVTNLNIHSLNAPYTYIEDLTGIEAFVI